MKRIRFLIGCIALLVAGAYAVFFLFQKHSPSSDYDISAAQLDEIKHKAIEGDAKSSKRLINFYLISQADERSALPWIRLAANQGDPDSRKVLIDILSRSNAISDKDEAKLLSQQWGANR